MIRFSLKCSRDHTFDSWFKSADAFETLSRSGMVSCAVCGDDAITKSVMAPRVGTRSEDTPDKALSAPPTAAEQALRALRARIEADGTYVGKNFAREARAIHEGSAPDRLIYGEARIDEARRLAEDGVPVTPLPFAPNRKTN